MADNLKQALLDCNLTCKQLTELLQAENDCLQARKDIKIIEENVKTKKHLTTLCLLFGLWTPELSIFDLKFRFYMKFPA